MSPKKWTCADISCLVSQRIGKAEKYQLSRKAHFVNWFPSHTKWNSEFSVFLRIIIKLCFFFPKRVYNFCGHVHVIFASIYLLNSLFHYWKNQIYNFCHLPSPSHFIFISLFFGCSSLYSLLLILSLFFMFDSLKIKSLLLFK